MTMNADCERLAALAASTTRKAEVKALLAETKNAWETARAQAILAEERLKTETADVERLDKKSLPNLLLTVTGKMEDKRAAETAEANEAQAFYDSANTRAEELHGQVVSLELELRSLGNCDKDLEILTNAIPPRSWQRAVTLPSRSGRSRIGWRKTPPRRRSWRSCWPSGDG